MLEFRCGNKLIGLKNVLMLFFVFFLALVGPGGVGAESPDSLAREAFYWYDGSTPKPVFLALDELAVFSEKPGQAQPDAAGLENTLSRAAVVETGEFVSFLKTEPPWSQDELSMAGASLENISGVGGVGLVFYPGSGRDQSLRLVPTGKIIVKFPSDMADGAIRGLEAEFGLTRAKAFSFAPNSFLYDRRDSLAALNTANALYETGRVEFSQPDWLRVPHTRAVPDDPLFGDQWSLKNTGQGGGTAGEDVDVEAVWDDYRGSSEEIIAIVDDGMEIAHEDIAPNVIPGQSWDFVDGDDDPSPNPSVSERHGTACTGVAAARGFNGLGVSGVAPSAGLVGHRLLGAFTDQNKAEALSRNNQLIDIYSSSWGPTDGGYVIEAPAALVEEAVAAGTAAGRGGLGNVYVWAGGNGGSGTTSSGGTTYQLKDNANYDGFVNSRRVIAVAASTNLGEKASYSEEGANILVNAPSSGGTRGVATTDNLPPGGYNSDAKYITTFGGTSASCPLAAGIAALALQVNPNLTWRDVQHIFIAAAEKNDPTDEDWALNGFLLPVNHKYGFGRINAAKAARLAATWKSAGPEVALVTDRAAPNLAIPDNDQTGVVSSIYVEDDLNIEFVDVFFSAADHPYWGNLEVVLTSPAGTESVLAEQHESLSFLEKYAQYKYDDWRFGSVRHFGERAKGTWTLRVRDLVSGQVGTFQEWGLGFYGTKADGDPWLAWYALQAGSGDNLDGCFIQALFPSEKR
ncbi:MAG: S8 family peptidase [Pseudomonadota bacterium]